LCYVAILDDGEVQNLANLRGRLKLFRNSAKFYISEKLKKRKNYIARA
jgi:hypothetical protein